MSLDKIEEVEPANVGASDIRAEDAAWQTAVAAAPGLGGEHGPAMRPEKLYDDLKPFKERVSADIERHQREQREDG